MKELWSRVTIYLDNIYKIDIIRIKNLKQAKLKEVK